MVGKDQESGQAASLPAGFSKCNSTKSVLISACWNTSGLRGIAGTRSCDFSFGSDLVRDESKYIWLSSRGDAILIVVDVAYLTIIS